MSDQERLSDEQVDLWAYFDLHDQSDRARAIRAGFLELRDRRAADREAETRGAGAVSERGLATRA